MAELRRTTDYLRRGLDQAKALTRRRQQQAEAVIVEFAQREFAYFTRCVVRWGCRVHTRTPGLPTPSLPT